MRFQMPFTSAGRKALACAYEAWLDPANFDAGGTQKQSLSALIKRERGA
jgi:hypothetical protein